MIASWLRGLLALALILPLGAAALFGDEGSLAVIDFDLGRLNDSGLHGPQDGLRSMDYEFCIPASLTYQEAVAGIDPSARFMGHSRGRIGCGPAQVLVLGNTHQPGYREVLETLAALPYVDRISQAFFE